MRELLNFNGMQKIIVTGINGQLGSELKDLFIFENTYEVIYLSRLELPLEKLSDIQPTLSKFSPEIIIHAAAYTAVDKAEEERELANKINHLASAEIASYCKHSNCKLIAISTDYVFDGESNLPLKESALVNPINEYGKSKLLGEKVIQEILPSSIIIRTSWVYSVHGDNFVKTMVRLMTERKEISVINDQKGSPTYARDLALAINRIIGFVEWKPGIYHFSNEGEISWYEFAVSIKRIYNLDCQIHPIPTASYPTPAKRPKYSLLDKTKIKETYKVEVPFWEDSLTQMLSQLKQS